VNDIENINNEYNYFEPCLNSVFVLGNVEYWTNELYIKINTDLSLNFLQERKKT